MKKYLCIICPNWRKQEARPKGWLPAPKRIKGRYTATPSICPDCVTSLLVDLANAIHEERA